MRIALVTGASSGLGREFVRQLAHEPGRDEIWVVARREALRAACPLPVRVLALDLTRPECMDTLRRVLAEHKPNLRVLVNAAGMGRIGPTVDLPARDIGAMIDLNCRAAAQVTDAAFPYLHPGSRVLEVCSTAAFQPMPGLNVYAATKAFLLSYTQSLHYELAPAGIRVTAVCPYWVMDAENIGIASANGQRVRHYPLASRSAGLHCSPCRGQDSAHSGRAASGGPDAKDLTVFVLFLFLLYKEGTEEIPNIFIIG